MWALRTEAGSPRRASALNYPALQSRASPLVSVCLFAFSIFHTVNTDWVKLEERKEEGKKAREGGSRLIYLGTLLKR